MTYTQIFNKVWTNIPDNDRRKIVAELDDKDRMAWKIIKFFSSRKGFDWWWRGDDIDNATRDEMFEELKKLL